MTANPFQQWQSAKVTNPFSATQAAGTVEAPDRFSFGQTNRLSAMAPAPAQAVNTSPVTATTTTAPVVAPVDNNAIADKALRAALGAPETGRYNANQLAADQESALFPEKLAAYKASPTGAEFATLFNQRYPTSGLSDDQINQYGYQLEDFRQYYGGVPDWQWNGMMNYNPYWRYAAPDSNRITGSSLG